MSNAPHTQGSIRVNSNKTAIVHSDDGRIACPPNHSQRWAWDENARRLVACWNACEGSSTEWLEFQTNPDAIEQFGRREPFETRYRTALQNGVKAVEQRDELLKALKGLLAVVNIAEAGNDGKPHQYLQSRSGSMVFSADAGADAMAAIAKAGSVDLPPVGFAPLCPDGHSSGA